MQFNNKLSNQNIKNIYVKILFSEMPHYAPMYSNWIDGVIPYHVESLIIIPQEETEEAVISLATVWDKYKITQEVLVANVSEEEYKLKYKETYFFKYFSNTPRYYGY